MKSGSDFGIMSPMKRTIVIAALAFALGFNASASEFLYDFSGEGERLDFESPVVRHETLPVACVPDLFVGDKSVEHSGNGWVGA